MAISLYSGTADWHDGVCVTWLGRLTINIRLPALSQRAVALVGVWCAGSTKRALTVTFAGRSASMIVESWVNGHGVALFSLTDPPAGEQEVIVQADNPSNTSLIFGAVALLGVSADTVLGASTTASGAAKSQTDVGLPVAGVDDVVVLIAGSGDTVTISDARLSQIDADKHNRDSNRTVLGMISGTDAASGPVTIVAGTRPMVAAAVTISGQASI
ncbi:MAG: hypothetical protein QM572_14585 [Nocardioides sp.]|uniref:hypothetical protein n=1 Tax=Nocardioides sp. TaxID=35761 RepID=UPI0039E5FD65